MARFRYDKDMECLVEIREGGNYPEPDNWSRPRGVMSDIAPYRAAASDVACGGKRPVISGRRQHREFLKRNGYVEVGTEIAAPRRDNSGMSQHDRVMDIKRALGE